MLFAALRVGKNAANKTLPDKTTSLENCLRAIMKTAVYIDVAMSTICGTTSHMDSLHCAKTGISLS